MKILRYSASFAFPALILLMFHSCTKVDPELARKESNAVKLTREVNADSLQSYVTWLQNMGTRFTLSDSRRNVASRIKAKFESFGYDSVYLDSFNISVTYRGTPYIRIMYNIIATLEGTTQADSVCIVGGHYDSIIGTGDPFSTAPGANDNASGTAAALEIARVAKKTAFKPEKTIRFVAFGAEELGLFGSKQYAFNALHTIEKISFMLNNDMIAYEPGTDRTKWSVNIIDYPNSRTLRQQAEKLCIKYTDLFPYNNNTYSNASDSYPFFVNGYKALFFFSDKMDPRYHTVNDLTEWCNFEYSAEIVKLNCAILANFN
jgi:hypothetical protein